MPGRAGQEMKLCTEAVCTSRFCLMIRRGAMQACDSCRCLRLTRRQRQNVGMLAQNFNTAVALLAQG